MRCRTELILSYIYGYVNLNVTALFSGESPVYLIDMGFNSILNGPPQGDDSALPTSKIIESKESKPEKLYRGFVLSPDNLSLEKFKEVMNPTETSGNDGNEKGVYMTDNSTMVESTNYSNFSVGGVEVPLHDSGRGKTNRIDLPGVGVVLEITTDNLPIREPKISSVWKGHYNNGFAGKEWISDTVTPDKYRVKRLSLAKGATDADKFVIELKDGSDEELQKGIALIKEKYEEKKAEAEEYKKFLTSIPNVSQLHEISLKRKWEKYLEEKTKR